MMSIVEPIQIGQALNRDGVLNLNKPAGWTSHDVVARLRKVLGVRKIGHAGTLDPPATGVLPILVGKGTRVAELLIDWDKEYEAVLRLGQVTETQDGTGTVVIERSTQNLKEETIRSVVAQFQGRLRQIPPMYSAIKIGGTPLYKMARAGRTVERQARWITVHQIEIQSIQGSGDSLWIHNYCGETSQYHIKAQKGKRPPPQGRFPFYVIEGDGLIHMEGPNPGSHEVKQVSSHTQSLTDIVA